MAVKPKPGLSCGKCGMNAKAHTVEIRRTLVPRVMHGFVYNGN